MGRELSQGSRKCPSHFYSFIPHLFMEHLLGAWNSPDLFESPRSHLQNEVGPSKCFSMGCTVDVSSKRSVLFFVRQDVSPLSKPISSQGEIPKGSQTPSSMENSRFTGTQGGPKEMTYLCEGTKQPSTQSMLHTLLAPFPSPLFPPPSSSCTNLL